MWPGWFTVLGTSQNHGLGSLEDTLVLKVCNGVPCVVKLPIQTDGGEMDGGLWTLVIYIYICPEVPVRSHVAKEHYKVSFKTSDSGLVAGPKETC